ncbi:MAG: tRNA (adenosine(37)-N6)-dimethylallyltransferase MiaA, partial [Pirellulales bacterium]|nr:tRNA (adenosine(37)-N6)-dimethylallyltransferase MiaA [Pirellulales bacterium]
RFVARRHPGVRLDTILRMGTFSGASALGREEEIGSLSPGKRADLAIVALPERDATDPHELIFDSTEPVVGCYCRGVAIKPRSSVAPKCARWGGSLTATPTERAHCSSSGATDGRGFMDCWFLSGPTASGKSAVGVELARRIGAEIVSLDSMALYRGMDIGTAKPTEAQRHGVPHHLIDVIEPWEEYSLSKYVEAAERITAEIVGRGRRTLFVGGTPLYLKGLLRGIFRGPPADWQLRRRLADQSQEHGGDWLHRRLLEVDPASAARLHPNDTRRLIRALEVFEKTGHPISELQRQFDAGRPAEECRVFVLDWPRDELYARIERRVEEMFAAGLVDEVRRLLARGPLSQRERGDILSRTARQAVGYREAIEHLEGRRGLAETIELVRRHTRQLAKRQMTWFRGLSECRFVTVSGRLDATELAGQIAMLGEC